MTRTAALLLALLLSCSRAGKQADSGAPAAPPAPDIILITVDTLRADALGYAGQQGVETPFIDQLAHEAIVFTNAHAHNVVTLPSHANILTGLYPWQHGVRDNAGYVLDPKFETVAARLKTKGYRTGAFVGAFPLDARYGLNRGFDLYDDKYPEGAGGLDFKISERSAGEVLQAAASWWREQQAPRFLWVHLYDPHAPYAPPPDFAGRYAGRAYLGEVAAVDHALGRWLAPLIGKETMVIFTADHGEALGDHGELTHGLFAYESTLRVPLFVRDPASARPRRETASVQHIDIAPTILERAGIDKPAEMFGQSLLRAQTNPRPAYFEALSASLNRGWAPLVGVIESGHKYIELPLPELYDLQADQAEANNLFTERRRVTAQLRKQLAGWAPSQQSAQRNVTPEQSAQLLSLGYLSGTAAKKNYTQADDPKNLIDIDNMLHRMIESYQEGKLEQALSMAREIVRRQPEMPVGQEMLAFMLQQNERSDAGIDTLRAAVKRGNATEAMRVRLGLMLSESGQAAEAVSILEPLAQKQDVDLLNAYGIALADLGRPAEAVRQFERVLQIDTTNATAHQNMGIVALRSGQVAQAEQHLTRALALSPRLPLALNTMGVVYARTHRIDQAIDSWEKAVQSDPALYDALFNIGVIASQNGRPDAARRALQRFIATAPAQRYARELAAARQMLQRTEPRRS